MAEEAKPKTTQPTKIRLSKDYIYKGQIFKAGEHSIENAQVFAVLKKAEAKHRAQVQAKDEKAKAEAEAAAEA